MRTINTKLLKKKIQWAYDETKNPMPIEKSIDSALKIYKEIKKSYRINEKGEVDYAHEFTETKSDLLLIFDIDYRQIKDSSKNNLYLLHQSLMVNSIYELLLKGEL